MIIIAGGVEAAGPEGRQRAALGLEKPTPETCLF